MDKSYISLETAKGAIKGILDSLSESDKRHLMEDIRTWYKCPVVGCTFEIHPNWIEHSYSDIWSK